MAEITNTHEHANGVYGVLTYGGMVSWGLRATDLSNYKKLQAGGNA
jgi:hypothetical protein